MWFITLLVLALAAYFIIKAVGASSKRKVLEQQTPTISADEPTSSPVIDSSDNPVATNAPTQITRANEPAAGAQVGLDTGDTLKDIQEMIKILNLAGADAGRLGISQEEFQAIRTDDNSSIPNGEQLGNIANKLRHMLA